MKILKSVNRMAGENTYYLTNNQATIVIDPGSNTKDILNKITSLGKPVVAILLTHTHYDHIVSVDDVREAFNHPPVYVSKQEADWLGSPKDNLSALGRFEGMGDVIIKPADYFYDDHKDYNIEGFQFKVVETPGHSIGSVSLIFPESEAVFTGDALFKGTIGRTDLPTGNYDQLITSIKTQLLTLPKHYRVFPGHGQNTVISHEKMFNPYLT
ncbi:MBL fold metallo-hydrolase [Streptococcus sp. CSL10205-OR2]|uniref:MBL fold metallo-hydrolase n=1 Tax=Streptococcus sp. CSL10205-OR2 TaxID=2980558 RepID=UPI0021D882B2|nr:MBL fold metallo-hydrolase [Streptococcus sp. CSL10205-OR2]MCU9534292.1 MBL fold metallo-hydrolase [Streptococcus sp. CSL10205-OR2]